MTIYSKQIWSWVVRLLLLLSIIFLVTFQGQGQINSYNPYTLLQEQDKQMHFGAGMIMSSLGYTWSYNKHQDKKRAIITGVCTAFAAGVMKEMYDATFGGYVEHGDVLATTLGGITITATIPLFGNRKKYGPKKYKKPKSKRKCGI